MPGHLDHGPPGQQGATLSLDIHVNPPKEQQLADALVDDADMSIDNGAVSLTWIDEISTLRPRQSPLEVALWLDSLVVAGRPIKPTLTVDLFAATETYVRIWRPWVRA